MSETKGESGQKPGQRIALESARHFERDGFSGDVYVEPDAGYGFSALRVDVHGRHPLKRMVDATRAYLVLEGSGTFTLNGESSEVKQGDFFVIPDGGEYEYEGQMEFLELNVPGTTSENSITLDPK